MTTLEQIKAKLQEDQKKKERSQSGSFGDNASFPFWNLNEGQTAVLRFLPDGDHDNVFFWVEKQNIKLKFQGTFGAEQDVDREVTISVPCTEMWGETCPILTETRPWWKDPAKENVARQYWKKKTYIFQGFVVNSPLQEETVPDNPIRRFVINPSIFEIIKNSLMNPEMEDIPTDYEGGRDFKLTKTKKGDYANYTTSQWSFKTRSLSEEERIAIDQHGLFNLKEYMGRHPDADEKEVIVAMFHDSLAGKPFDVTAYGKYYRPYGVSVPQHSSPVVETAVESAERSFTPPPLAAPKFDAVAESGGQQDDDAPSKKTAKAEGGKPNAAEILQRIKDRQMSAAK